MRFSQHLLDCDLVLGSLLAIPPVLIGQLPLLERTLLSRLEPFQLLLGGDMHPELGEHHALRNQRPLEVDDLGVGPTPLLNVGKSLDSLNEHPSVPGPVQHRDISPAGKVWPEPLEPVVPELLC